MELHELELLAVGEGVEEPRLQLREGAVVGGKDGEPAGLYG